MLAGLEPILTRIGILLKRSKHLSRNIRISLEAQALELRIQGKHQRKKFQSKSEVADPSSSKAIDLNTEVGITEGGV